AAHPVCGDDERGRDLLRIDGKAHLPAVRRHGAHPTPALHTLRELLEARVPKRTHALLRQGVHRMLRREVHTSENPPLAENLAAVQAQRLLPQAPGDARRSERREPRRMHTDGPPTFGTGRTLLEDDDVPATLSEQTGEQHAHGTRPDNR